MMRQNSKGEWMVLFQLFEENETERIKLLDFLLQKFPQIHTLLYAINPKGNDSIYDRISRLTTGKGFV